MKLKVIDVRGTDCGEVELPFSIIENGRGTQAVHDEVVAHGASQRSGTASTKTMGEVAGTGKKPWRQKGTGRARAGSFASPLWRGGGVVFGPKPRDFSKKVGKRTRALAFHKALSERIKGGDVVLVDELKLPAAKTAEMVRVLRTLELSGSTLVVVADNDEGLGRACRNIPGLQLTIVDSLNTYELIKPDRLLITRSAMERIGMRMKEQSRP
jgi:large subunit ribosomal protein L4